MKNKRVIIIGGGISGLAAGIYAKINGYDAVILEKNHVLGGACIGWERKGCYIDGCIHWMTGINPKSKYYDLWTEVGAISPQTEYFFQDDFYTLDFGGDNKFTVWADTDKLERELIAFAPEDEKQIKSFCKLIKRFRRIEGPVQKPVDMMNLSELLKIAFTMLGDYYYVSKTSKISCEDYAKKFKNEYIRKWIAEHMSANYNLMSMLYMLGQVSRKNGGIPLGASRTVIDNMQAKYLSLGGEIRYNAEVANVNVDNGVATGVTLKNGEVLNCDYTVSATPIEHTLKVLLGGKYSLKSIDDRLKDEKTYPIYTYTTAVFKCNEDLSSAPLSHKVYPSAPIILEKAHSAVTFRNYAYDKTLKVTEGCTVVQATISGEDEMYYWWKSIKENGGYKAEKQKIADTLLKIFLSRYPSLEGKVEIIDVITPMTYERYLNTRHGSFQGFVHTAKGKSLMQKGVIKNLRNFILAGQGIFRSGGMPPAAITGRFAIQRICKKDKKKFMYKPL
ncbi:MAG: NAD(P)/FAD-dependent oxidoreductase [Clostridia bacterium]|nr:NAD(P)/FAD-dependent oxidoreductase [Clostridia bacterium]